MITDAIPVCIDALSKDDPLRRSMRQIGRYWQCVHSKLLCMEWEYTDENGYHPAVKDGKPVHYGATDGKLLILNPKGIQELIALAVALNLPKWAFVAFLLVHEGLHAILNHGFRLSRFLDPDAANEAADYIVNGMMHKRNLELGRVVFPIPKWALLNPKLSGNYSTEQLYQFFRKKNIEEEEQPQEEPTQDPDGEEQQEQQEPQGGPGDKPGPPDQPDEQQDGQGDPGDGGSGDEQSESESGEPGGSGDEQSESESGEPGAQTPDPGDKKLPGAGGRDTFKPVAASPEEERELERELEELNERLMVVDALDTHSHGVDSAATRRIAEERNQNKPQDWAAIAEQFVEVRCASGWRSNYNHAVYVTTGLAAPGRQGKKIGDIICVSDSSGSIGKEAWQKFFELNQYILDDIQPDRMLLISCAEEVKDHTILEAGDTVPTKMTGGGGTSFKAAFDWIKEDPEDLCIEPLLLIYFTDGLCEDHKRMQEPEYPVLCLSYHKEKSGFPWGEFAKISVK